jgi:gas vesicle protein
MSKNSSNSIISFFVGLLLGGVFGVLFAPDRGTNTRDRLTYRLNKYKLRIQDLLEEILEDKEIKKSASGKEEKKVVNDAKDKAEKLLKDVDGILTKMKKK